MQKCLNLYSKLPSRYRKMPVQAILVFGVFISTVASTMVWHLEREELSKNIHQSSQELSLALQRAIDKDLFDLQKVSSFRRDIPAKSYATQNRTQGNKTLAAQSNRSKIIVGDRLVLEKQAFKKFASEAIVSMPGIQRLDWVPRVPHSERSIYEAKLEAQFSQTQSSQLESSQAQPSQTQPSQTQPSQTQPSQAGSFVEKPIAPVPVRAEYFPIAETTAKGNDREILGLDLASDPASWLAMEKARDAGQITATEAAHPLQISAETDEPTVRVFLPIYRRSSLSERSPANPEKKRQNLEGFVVATVAIAELVKAALPGVALNDLNVYLYEGELNKRTTKKTHQTLAFYESDTHAFARSGKSRMPKLTGRGWLCPEFSVASRSSASKGFRRLRQNKAMKPCQRQIALGDRQWSLLLLPTAAYNSPQKHWGALVTLGSGLLLTSLVVTYLLASLGYIERVEQLVKERTAKAKQLEEALQELQETQTQLIQTEKMSSLGQMAAGIAHEINNPVNFISGNISCAEEYANDLLDAIAMYQEHNPNPTPAIAKRCDEIDLDFLKEDLPNLLSSMRVGVDRICQIVQSMRNFSRLDEAEMKAVDLHEGIDSTLLILNNRFKAKPDLPEIKVMKKYGNLPRVECYPGQFNQVFMNILANAIDAMESHNLQRRAEEILANPSRIIISTEVQSNDSVTVRIADNGPGIPPEVKTKIFDPFFTTKPVGKGTGLGMSISYKIVVDKHGGTLICNSEVGKGTEFNIDIPLRCNRKPNLKSSEGMLVAS